MPPKSNSNTRVIAHLKSRGIDGGLIEQCTLKEARTAIQEEMPLVVCCDLDLPDGSGMDFLDEVRAADKELPFYSGVLS